MFFCFFFFLFFQLFLSRVLASFRETEEEEELTTKMKIFWLICVFNFFLFSGLEVPRQVDGYAAMVPGFQIDPLNVQGVTEPVKVVFDGQARMWVLERNGRLKVFSSMNDNTGGQMVCDLSNRVYSWWDHGSLGFALHPNFVNNGKAFILYTTNAMVDGSPSGFAGAQCPDNFCRSSARLSRLIITLPGGPGTNFGCVEEVLIATACSTSPSHHVGDVFFGPLDGLVYFALGDGAQFNFLDSGYLPNGQMEWCLANSISQFENTSTPTLGGAWRSQFSYPSQGKLLRVNPDFVRPAGYQPQNWRSFPLLTGVAMGNTPFVAKGFRNPFRMKAQPGSNPLQVVVGDVGLNTWEAIWKFSPSTAPPKNMGWPCREGGKGNPGFVNTGICGNPNPPFENSFLSYHHLVNLGTCPRIGSSSITALEFYQGAQFPTAFQGALFLGDFSRNCLWYILIDPNTGQLEIDPNTLNPKVRDFDQTLSSVADISNAPDGSLIVVRIFGDIPLFRISFGNQNGNVITGVSLTTTPTIGTLPLSVTLKATVIPANVPLLVSDFWIWRVTRTSDQLLAYQGQTPYNVLTVPVTLMMSGVFSVQVELHRPGVMGNPTLISPATQFTVLDQTRDQVVVDFVPTPSTFEPSLWSSGTMMHFESRVTINGVSLKANDPLNRVSQLRWVVKLLHCIWNDCLRSSSDCHIHPLISVDGSLTLDFLTPSHPFPSYLVVSLEYRLNTTREVLISPSPLERQFSAQPVQVHVSLLPFALLNETTNLARSEMRLLVGEEDCVVPCHRDLLNNASLTLLAPVRLSRDGNSYWEFASWENDDGQVVFGGTSANVVVFPTAGSATFFARYVLKNFVKIVSGLAGSPGSLPPESCAGALVSWGAVTPTPVDFLLRVWNPSNPTQKKFTFSSVSAGFQTADIENVAPLTQPQFIWQVAPWYPSLVSTASSRLGNWSINFNSNAGSQDTFWCPLECPFALLDQATSSAAWVLNQGWGLIDNLTTGANPVVRFQLSPQVWNLAQPFALPLTLRWKSLISGNSWPPVISSPVLSAASPVTVVLSADPHDAFATEPSHWNQDQWGTINSVLSINLPPSQGSNPLTVTWRLQVKRGLVQKSIDLQIILTVMAAPCPSPDSTFGCVASLDPLPSPLINNVMMTPQFNLSVFFNDPSLPAGAQRVLYVELIISQIWVKKATSVTMIPRSPLWQIATVTVSPFQVTPADLVTPQEFQWHVYFTAPGATWDTRQNLWTKSLIFGGASPSVTPSISPSRRTPSPSPSVFTSWPVNCVSSVAGCVDLTTATKNFVLSVTQPSFVISGVRVFMNGPVARDLWVELMQRVTWNKYASVKLNVASSVNWINLNPIVAPPLVDRPAIPLLNLEFHFYFVPLGQDWTTRTELFVLPITLQIQ